MAVDHRPELKSLNRLAFQHYLRTGQRLTSQEWLARHEHKFNPYHDELGRFTSPPGVTVSYGSRGGPNGSRPSLGRQQTSERRGVNDPLADGRRHASGATSNVAGGTSGRISVTSGPSASASVDAAIQKDWSPEAPIQTRFDLNRRQFYLDTLRQQAGTDASPMEKAAFEETQRRLDAARVRLDANDRVADREVLEVLRTGAAPVDVIAGGINIASGDGELRDYLAVAGVLPLGGMVGKVGKLATSGRIAAEVAEGTSREIVQLGGPHWRVRRNKPPGYAPHHVPANAGNGLRYGEGPTIAMRIEDHARTASHSSMPGSRAYIKMQRDLIKAGKFREALEMDIRDIRAKFGSSYDDAIRQMLEYVEKKGY